MMNHSDLEIKISKTGEKIPAIKGVHLHSAYNPTKEADNLISEASENILKKKKVLVLGLGFGYHIDSLINLFRKNNISEYEVFVVEPNDEIVKECLDVNPKIKRKNINLVTGRNISEFYQNTHFIDFLSSQPLVLPHTASFNLEKDFFKELMSFRASNRVSDIAHIVKNQKLLEAINSYSENTTLSEIANVPDYEEDFEILCKLLTEFAGEKNEQ